jgi:hypothetical protein
MTAPPAESGSTPSTRGRISRLLVWLGALSALASFVLAEPLGSRLGTLAIGCAVLSLLVWRGWRPAPHGDAPPTTPLDDATLVEALARIRQACAPDRTLDDALRDVVRLLAQELGARNARASLVGTNAERPQLSTLLDLAAPGARRPPVLRAKVAAAEDRSPLQRALASGGVVSDPPHGYAVAVAGHSAVVAVVDFDALELEVDPDALARLLTALHQAVAGVAARPAGAPAVLAGLGSSAEKVARLSGGADEVGFLASINADREVGLFVLEPQHLRLVAVSRRAERDFGVRRQRVLGKTLAQAFGTAIELNLDTALRSVLAGNETVEQTLTWPSPRGQRGANLSLRVLRRPDAPPRWLVGMVRPVEPLAALGPERRAMPRHGLLVDDTAPRVAARLARPTVPSNRSAKEP